MHGHEIPTRQGEMTVKGDCHGPTGALKPGSHVETVKSHKYS